MDIVEGNKLIAEFMDKLDGDNFYKRNFPLDDLSFHEKWDWLMPVVAKASTYFFIDCEGYGGFDIEYMMGDSELGWHLKIGNIDEVWAYMIKFIEWYNKQNL